MRIIQFRSQTGTHVIKSSYGLPNDESFSGFSMVTLTDHLSVKDPMTKREYTTMLSMSGSNQLDLHSCKKSITGKRKHGLYAMLLSISS
jgi:hypothetical protein